MGDIKSFIKFLDIRIKDRGMMADLRHAFSASTSYRAWPHLAPWCSLENRKERIIWLTIAGAYAILEGSVDNRNLGYSLYEIACKNGHSVDAIKRFDGRLRRLISCRTSEELCSHLPGLFRLAKAKNIKIDLIKLFWDIKNWENTDKDIKAYWASSYWGQGEI